MSYEDGDCLGYGTMGEPKIISFPLHEMKGIIVVDRVEGPIQFSDEPMRVIECDE